jgi:hypothetical protein
VKINCIVIRHFSEIRHFKTKFVFKKESELTKGKKWYGLPATEITEEVKRDLEIVQMRSVLDPKRFYKKNDMKVLPKYFQVCSQKEFVIMHYKFTIYIF